jgi:hypothetical protein
MSYLTCKRWAQAGCAAAWCAQGAGAEQAAETTLEGNRELRGQTMRQQNIKNKPKTNRGRLINSAEMFHTSFQGPL